MPKPKKKLAKKPVWPSRRRRKRAKAPAAGEKQLPPPAFDLLSPADYSVGAMLIRRCVAVAAARIGDAVFNLSQKGAPDPPVQYAEDLVAFSAGYFRGIREAEAAIEAAAQAAVNKAVETEEKRRK